MSYSAAKEQHCRTVQFFYRSLENKNLFKSWDLVKNLCSYSYMCFMGFSLHDPGGKQKGCPKHPLSIQTGFGDWGVVAHLGFF